MNETDIRKYAELMRELGLTGLEITNGDNVVRLERTAPSAPVSQVISAPSPAPEKAEDADYISVRSPIVGVFYAAPSEDADPFVSVGDHVEKGSTLCIIEAMKLMNEISADETGTVTEVCVENGQIVEYGTELFRLRR